MLHSFDLSQWAKSFAPPRCTRARVLHKNGEKRESWHSLGNFIVPG